MCFGKQSPAILCVPFPWGAALWGCSGHPVHGTGVCLAGSHFLPFSAPPFCFAVSLQVDHQGLWVQLYAHFCLQASDESLIPSEALSCWRGAPVPPGLPWWMLVAPLGTSMCSPCAMFPPQTLGADGCGTLLWQQTIPALYFPSLNQWLINEVTSYFILCIWKGCECTCHKSLGRANSFGSPGAPRPALLARGSCHQHSEPCDLWLQDPEWLLVFLFNPWQHRLLIVLFFLFF